MARGFIWIIGGVAALALAALLVFRPWEAARTPSATSPEAAASSDDAAQPDDLDAAARAEEEARKARAAADQEPDAQRALQADQSWAACSDGDVAACRAYVDEFPDGEFVSQANAKIDELTAPVAADLSGAWDGSYGGGGNQRTPFEVEITGAPGRFQGRMSEVNTFADQSFPRLFANISGETRADGVVTFTKTYDGTAGVSHSVSYEGRIDDAGRTIAGRWRIGAASGDFQMQRR